MSAALQARRVFLIANAVSSAILQQVVDATRGEYVVHGTLGESDALGSAFLAREVATDRSVLLVVPRDAESLDVVAALSDGVPADAGGCAACGFRVATWVDLCPRCDRSLLPPPGPGPDAAVLRDQLRDSFDVVGSLPHVRGGTVYFGDELPDRRLTAFVVRPAADGQLTLDVVWEAVADTAPVVPTFAAASATTPAPRDGSYTAVDAEASEAGAAPVDDAPASYYATDAEQADPRDTASASRRRWLPVGLGVGALAAVGAVAVLLTRHSDAAPVRPPTDTATQVVTRVPDSAKPIPRVGTGPSGPGTGGLSMGGASTGGASAGGTNVVQAVRPESTGSNAPIVATDSIRLARRMRRHLRDSLSALNAASMTIDGDLPNGWTRSVNGAAVGHDRKVSLTVGVPVTIRIDAPGYCPDTISLTPTPKSSQHWAPMLRGRPTVGDC